MADSRKQSNKLNVSVITTRLVDYVFYTPTACGGVKGGDIIHHYGIRKNVA